MQMPIKCHTRDLQAGFDKDVFSEPICIGIK